MRFRHLAPLLVLAMACERAAEITSPQITERATTRARVFTAASLEAPLAVQAPSGLRACWAGEGNATDVINNQSGSMSGSVGFAPGRFGQGFSYTNRYSDVVMAPSAALNVGSGPGMTMAAWIFPKGRMFGGSAATGAGPVMEYDFGAQLWQHTQYSLDNGLFTNMAENNDPTGWNILQIENVVPWNSWSHVATTYDRTSGFVTLYLNGSAIATRYIGNITPNTTTPLHIGARQNGSFTGGDFTFNGLIDEAQLYDRALSASEMSYLASAPATMCVRPPASYSLYTQPSTTGESGVPFTTQPVVEIRDETGARALAATTPVTASVFSGNGTLLGTTTVMAFNGLATFTDLAIAGTDPTTITFTASGLPLAPGGVSTSTAVTTTQVVRQFHVLTQPVGATDGSPLATQPVVELRDAAGLKVNNATTAVSVSVASGPGAVTGTTTVNAVAGVATFSGLIGQGVGTSTLGFSAVGATTGISAPFTIAEAPRALRIATAPAGAESGVPLTTQPIIEVRDLTSGDLVTSFNGAVTVSIASGNGALSGTTTVNAVNGVATFTNLQIAGSGLASLRFTTVGAGSVVSSTFPVVQLLHSLAIISAPTSGISGEVLSPATVVELRDAAGLRIVGGSQTVTVSNTGSLTLGGTTTVNAVDGVATFSNLILSGTGTVTLSFASAGAPAATAAVTPNLVVVSNAPTALQIATQPNGSESGVNLTSQPVVRVMGEAGLLVGGSTAAVTASIASGSGTLSGTTTVNAVGGIATFTNLRISGSGAHTLRFTSSGLTAATSASFTVAQPVRTVVVTQQPTNSAAYQLLATAPRVELRDAAGLLVTSASVPVTVSIASGTGTLSGTTTVNAVGGIATFGDLIVNGSGTFALRFTVAGATAGVSNSFTVTAPPVSYIFDGFYAPVSNPGIINGVQAGEDIPIKFGLRSTPGAIVFAAGFPASAPADCTTMTVTGPFSQIDANGDDREGDGSMLKVRKANDKYNVTWKTVKPWANSCRVLHVKLADGQQRTAWFRFR